MYKTLIFSDPHIEESAFDELNAIFSEIKKEKADQLVILGDYFDKKGRVTSKELIFGSEWLRKFKQRYERVVWVSGNHDNTQDVSLADIFKPWGIQVVYGSYLAPDSHGFIYYGHEFAEDTLAFDTKETMLSLSKLRKRPENIRLVFLGHYHDHRILVNEDDFTACYVGSCRYIKFDEKDTISKYFFTVEGSEVKQHTIESTIPLINITYDQIGKLNDLSARNKVRLILKSLDEYKNIIMRVSTCAQYFNKFTIKHDYTTETVLTPSNTDSTSLSSLTKDFIDRIKDDGVRLLIEQEFKKENLI